MRNLEFPEFQTSKRLRLRVPRCPFMGTKPPLLPGGAYTVEENDQDYSWRKARIGSALDARYAGMTAAKEAASSNAPALNAIVAGSADVVS